MTDFIDVISDILMEQMDFVTKCMKRVCEQELPLTSDWWEFFSKK